ncbi:uncharacterized protein LOC121369852 [Gigantopelta aegis]|uniref:uncharacterized protein LOC121369852 n=1 Tax=Gigantopelta aegis TaxID=1735272 RepID=UPI001B88A818|nr:uncharacterized protein LOC121369852 [Gigantopelta aegis]
MSSEEAMEVAEEATESVLTDRMNNLAMQTDRLPFPCNLQAWSDIRHLLVGLRSMCVSDDYNLDDIVYSVQDIHTAVQAGYQTNDFDVITSDKVVRSKDRHSEIDFSFVWYGLFEFLQCNCPVEESKCFVQSTLPKIIDLVLSVEEFIPPNFCYSRQQQGGSTVLTRTFVARILACAFLCVFPERTKDYTTYLNRINFTAFFRNLYLPAQIAKLRMILNYFERITQKDSELTGNIVYCRQVIEPKRLPTLEDLRTSTVALCPVPVYRYGNLEDIRSDGIQVDFANRYIGGGVLGRGKVQEEIRFCECPELIASLLFMESMEENEAIVMSGFEQFSSHYGYAADLEYGGDFVDPAERDSENNLKTILCAIDAINYNGCSKWQYELHSILREVNKALVGFCLPTEDVSQAEPENLSMDEDFQSAMGSFEQEESPGKNQKQMCDIAISLFAEPASKVSSCLEQTNHSDHHLERPALATSSDKPTDIGPPPPDQPVVCVSASSSPGDTPLLDSGRSFGERRQPISPVAGSQNASSDLLDVNYSHKVSCVRRRSSNLSDISGRSSTSTKRSSSDLSSDLEEFYESYLKNEKLKQHRTIHENGFQPVICNFAKNLVSHLMQEGISVAAHRDPQMLTFDVEPLPDSIVKPYPCRPSPQKVTSGVKSESSNATEIYASYLMQTVMTSALMEAALIFKYISASVDSAISASHLSLPEDESYHLFADQIVQDVLLTVSSDYAAGLLGNLSSQSLSHDFGASQTPRELSANLTVSASSACSFSSEPASQRGDKKTLSESESEKALSSIAAGETSGFVPVSSSPAADSGQETGVRTETPSCTIPKSSEHVVVDRNQNAGIQVSYQEAAAIIVDQVFQSLSHHAEHGNQSKLCGSVKSSCKGMSDGVSSVSDSLPLGTECQEEVVDSKSVIESAIFSSFGIPTKHLSRETLTNAFLNVEGRRQIKSYERRSSEPCHISVSLSLKTYCVSKPYSKDDRKLKSLRTDDDFLQVLNKESVRRGSWSSFPTSRRRSSCGFRDPVLSRFAEELMKADTSIPPLLIMSAHTGTSTTGSRRSSGFRDLTLANLEGELLNSSFCSPRQSLRSKSCCGGHHHQHYDRHVRSDSTCSETEHWFPLPKKVGREFQEEFDRLGRYHSVDEIEDLADTFANNIIQQAIGIIYRDAGLDFSACCLNHPNLLSYAASLAWDITNSALLAVQDMTEDEMERMRRRESAGGSDDGRGDDDEFVDTLDVPLPRVQLLAENMADEILKSVLNVCDDSSPPKKHFRCRGLPLATGNWGCGAFCGDPQLKCMLQWIAASEVHIPSMHYYTFDDPRLEQIEEVIALIESLQWTVGDLVTAVEKYCVRELDEFNSSDSFLRDQTPSFTFFEYMLFDMYR